MEESLNIDIIKGIIHRRWKIFTATFALILFSGIAVALILPPIYRSEGVIVVEEQQIPDDYVKSTISEFVEERIEMIKQQVLTRKKLFKIIEKFNLYPDMRESATPAQLVDEMRKAIEISTISAKVVNQKTGRPQSATIAFSLSYEGRNPDSVHKVANRLTSLFLEEDLKRRAKLASTTTNFLEEEKKNLEEHIRQNEEEISKFKQEHLGELPANMNANLQAINRYERELDRLETKIRTMDEQMVYLQGRIATLDPLAPVMTANGKVSQNPTNRLKAMRLQLTTLQSTLSPKHPDIKKLKREIKELEAQVGKTDDSLEKIKQLQALKTELAAVKGKKGPKHPDVVKLSKEIEVLSREVGQLKIKRTATQISNEQPDNPAYISLKTQITAAQIMKKNLLQERARLKDTLEKYYKRLENAPMVEKAYNELMRNYQALKAKHAELSKKLMTAKISQVMEQTQRGEKFIISDPPQYPKKPYKPNRVAIVLAAFILGIGAGVGLAMGKEALDPSVKTTHELKNVTGIPVFSAIPVIESDEEKRAKRFRKVIWVSAALGLVIIALALVNQLVMPLDILLAKIQKRIMI